MLQQKNNKNEIKITSNHKCFYIEKKMNVHFSIFQTRALTLLHTKKIVPRELDIHGSGWVSATSKPP